MPITKKVTYINEEGFVFQNEPIENSLKIIKTKDGYEARYMIQDENGYSPRDDDNLGTMVCFHRKYSLGDKTDLNSDNFDGWQALKDYLKKELKAVVILPLYLYDHGRISIAIAPHGQHYSWDGGQVGFVYVTKEQLKKEGVTKKRAEKILMAEVEDYNSYLIGDCYILVKETYNKDKEPIDRDSVGGYLGCDYAIKAVETEI